MASRRCRICGKESNIISVFTSVDGEPLSDKIKMIAGVRISQKDNLPKFICIGCIGKVNKCVDIQRQIQFGHRMFYGPTDMIGQNEAVNEAISSDQTHNDVETSKDSGDNAKGLQEQTIPFELLDRSPSPIPCEICGIFSPTVATWKAHMRSHQQFEFKCDICGKILAHKANLEIHMRLHDGVIRFTCSTCGQQFVTKQMLKVHERRHAGIKPYSCLVCGKQFKSYNAKFTHMRHEHSNSIDEFLK